MLLVGTDVKYAASGGTLNAALTPDLLDAHSIGIYLVGSDGQLKLVVQSGTTPATGLVLASAVLPTDKITMFQGLGSGNQFTSETHQVNGIRKVLGSVYRAGTPQTVYIGYDPTVGAGDLNAVFYPVSANGPYGLTFSDPDLLYRQECSIKFKVREFGNNEFGNTHYITVPVVPADTTLSIAQKLVAQANMVQPFDTLQYFTASLTGIYLATPIQSASTTATTGGTVPAGTYYSTIAYYGTNGGSLGSNEESVTTTGSTSTVTFNWGVPPTGTTSSRVFVSTTSGNYTSYYNVASGSTHTLTITALGTPVAGVLPVAGTGIALTDNNWPIPPTALYNDEDPMPRFAVSVFGVIQNAPINQGGVIEPSGAPWQIRKIERTSMSYRGNLNPLSVLDRGTNLPSQVDFTATYDLYQVVTINVTDSKDGQKALTDQKISTYIAFVVQGNTLGTDQQADWQSIMTSIFPATAQIS